MQLISLKDNYLFKHILLIIISAILICSCNITRKAPKDKPYLAKNSIEIVGGNFSTLDKSALIDRLSNQMDDSSKLKTKDVAFIITILKKPTAYDTAYSSLSASNMKASMVHLGYYNSKVSYRADTSGKKVSVHYKVEVGNPTRIDTLIYKLYKPDLQALALKYRNQNILAKDNPVSKTGVYGEIARQVDTFRNNGYYKFTAAELRMRGDTSIEALTNISDDPFEQLRILAEAQQKRDSPTIKLAMVINTPEDSTKLNKYHINNIYVLYDHIPGDDLKDTINITQTKTRNFVLRYHEPIFRQGFISRNITLRPGQLYNESEFNKTLALLSKTGVWQSVNIDVKELPDSSKIDMIAELVPVKKYGFEASLEAAYSATSNTNNAVAGNLFGLSGNLSLVNRNIGREAIRMTHRLHAGVELNNNSRGNNIGLINSNEIGYSNNVVIPRNIFFIPNFLKDKTRRRNRPGESFINSSFSYSERIKLFSLQTFSLSLGKSVPDKNNNAIRNTNWIFRPFNTQFSYLYNETDSFKTILADNPFLAYSYNTSFVIGIGAGFSTTYLNPVHVKSLSKARNINVNIEESGLTWGLLPILNKYKARFIKLDAEYKYTVNYKKTTLVMRGFTGVGVPLFKDQTLPFFKQFFGGGTYSMRGWPVRGIGRGGQPLPTYNENIFNDRTGDIQLEMNGEYRYNIAHLIPNLLTLRGAVFVDIGNIWNLKKLTAVGIEDSAQFKFGKIYNQIGLSAGTGFRLDFNYVVLRFDFGFRFKRPELSYYGNNGWKVPDIAFNDAFKKIFARGQNDEYRKWRYENFNFTIGISYPF